MVATASLLALVSCDAASGQGGPSAQATASPSTAATASKQPLDGLSIELHLTSESVEAGRVVASQLDVENNSGRTIVDRSCWLAAGRFGVVPADEPDAELWQAVVVDCAGPRMLADGFTDRFSGPDFQASDMYGEPLPPGDYVAALEIEGFSERLSQPLEIVATR
jgi:hypothetical protein